MIDALLLEQLIDRNNPRAIAAQLRTATNSAAELTFLQKWYNLYSFCPDRLGHGNLEQPIRQQYLKLLGRVFQRAAQTRQQIGTPFQLILYVHLKNSAYDSIEIHTPNPQQDNFPLSGFRKPRPESGEVASYLSKVTGVEALRVAVLGDCIYAFSPSHGISMDLAQSRPIDGTALLKRLKSPPISRQAVAAHLHKAKKVAETTTLDLSKGAWFEGHHFHLDWKGHSNLTWKIRERYLALMGQLYIRLAHQLQHWSEPYQLFISLDVFHAEYDAVYLHSYNPNRDNFPITMKDLCWDVPHVRDLLAERLPIPNLRVGFDRTARSLCIYSPQIGVPLES